MRARAGAAALAVAALASAVAAPAAVRPLPLGPGLDEVRTAVEAWHVVHAAPYREVPPAAQAAGWAAATAARASAARGGARLRWESFGPAGAHTRADAMWTGAGRFSGRVSSLALVPGQPRRAFVGAATGGVWRTDDDGRSWTPVGDSLPTLSVGAVAVDPAKPDRVYVGTGEANEQASVYGAGIFRSDNAGRTWTAANGTAPFAGCATADLVVRGNVVLAAITRFSWMRDPAPELTGCAATGIWRSTDAGRSWTRVSTARAQDLAVVPREGPMLAVGAGDATVLRSDDDGRSWRPTPLGLAPSVTVQRAVVSIAPDDPARWYTALVGLTGRLLGVWTTANAGLAWTPIPAPTDPCDHYGSPVGYSGQCWYDLTILAEPRASVLVGGVLLQRWSVTGATTLLGFGSSGIHVDQHALARDDLGRTWVGNDGGVYRTPDGRTWRDLNKGLAITQFNPGAAARAGQIIAGTQDNGTLMHERGRWEGVLGADGGAAVAPEGDRSLLFASIQGLGLRRSRDDGLTWRDITNGIADRAVTAFYSPFIGDPRHPRTLYAGTGRVHRSTDAGTTWTAVSPTLGQYLTALAVSPADSSHLYAGGLGLVWSTSDAGLTWRPARGIPNRVVTSVLVDPRDPATAWLTVGGYGTAHVLATRDHGLTWTPVGTGLPDVPAHALWRDGAGALYAGTTVGVFRHERGRWTAEPVGLPAVPVTGLLLADRCTLVATTYGRSAFRARLPERTCS